MRVSFGFCSFKLGPGQVDEVFSETTQKLVDRTSALVELAAEAWIVTGRHPLPLLMATVYVAWQSLNPKVREMPTANILQNVVNALKNLSQSRP